MANLNTGKGSDELKIVDVPADLVEDFLDRDFGFAVRSKFLYQIETKNGDEVNYVPWTPQQIIDQVIKEEKERTLKELDYIQVFLIYLKSRQMGLSTDTSLRNLDRMLFFQNHNVQVLAHDRDGTSEVYSIYKTAFNNLPDFVRFVEPEPFWNNAPDPTNEPIKWKRYIEKNDSRPGVVADGEVWYHPVSPGGKPTKKQIQFNNMTQSYCRVSTAGKRDQGGKGGRLNSIHYSENANYPDHDTILSSVNQQLGGQDLFGVKESTANGTAGKGEGFYKDWTIESKAWRNYKQGNQNTFEGWRPTFIPWYWLPEYRKSLYQGEKVGLEGIMWKSHKQKQEYLEWEDWIENEVIPKDDTVDENSYDVRESTNWYRMMIKTKAQKDLQRARRYYPTTPDEAFMTSDDCYFNGKSLHMVKTDLKEKESDSPHMRGYLDEDYKFQEFNGGELIIKEWPNRKYRNRYVAGCDQSEGHEDGDFSTIPVFDRITRQFVALWRGIVPENDLAKELVKIGYFYESALLVPEANRATVINLVKPDGELRYMGDLYYVKPEGPSQGRMNPQWGYKTHGTSRKVLLENYRSFLKGERDYPSGENPMGNYDTLFTLDMVTEHSKFLRNADGKKTKYEAAPGYTDDIVIGNALCIEGDDWWDRTPKLKAGYRPDDEDVVHEMSERRGKKSRKKPVGVRNSDLGNRGKNKRKKKMTVVMGGGKKQSKIGK